MSAAGMLCALCQARRTACSARPVTVATRTSEDAPDVPAAREHKMTITVWAACAVCSGGTR